MLSRRHFLAVTAFAIPAYVSAVNKHTSSLPGAFADLERKNGGRLGVMVLDTATGKRFGHRENERFPMCSTFKFLLASAVLQRVDRHEEKLERSIAIPPKPLLPNSPITEQHTGGTMTVSALCEAILTRSDNTGANLLLETIGGPEGITSFARSIGDEVTRLDRTETSLNESRPGDPRDTTSPAAMAEDLNRMLLGDVLSAGSREQLMNWMLANQTGLDKLRAGAPPTWRVADKTGNNGNDTMNDIAVLWPPTGKPIIVAAYVTQCPGPDRKRAAILKEIGTLAATSV